MKQIVLVSEATDTKAIRLAVVVHVAAATVEAQAPAVNRAALRTAPVVTV
jgi:hypothetical protein